MKKLFLLLLLGSSLFGQELPKIIPPSPEATSLGKYVEVPVSHYTGMPNISVPIHNINLDGKTIPVNLSYHAKGIKVEEIASRVGLGWALNTGGVITRQIKWKPDEKNGAQITSYLQGDHFVHSYQNTPAGVEARNKMYNSAINKDFDYMPDQFMFNFMGYSGKFIIDQKTKKPIQFEFSDLKIERVGNAFDSWVITTPDGYKAYFGKSFIGSRTAKDREKTLNSYMFDTVIHPPLEFIPSEPITAWYLLDVVSPQGNVVSYTYEEETPIYLRRSYDIMTKVNEGFKHPRSYFSRVQPTQYQVKEITFKEGKIVFEKKTTPREDLPGAYALNKVKVYSGSSLIKGLKFNYKYTQAVNSNDGNSLQYMIDNDASGAKRLFLDSIDTFGANENTFLAPYKFTYNETKLPNRFSNSQDVWGYYNGKNNGPFLTFLNYQNQVIDRKVDTLKNKAGILTKVEYPTGGFAHYEYETNKAIPPSYFKGLLFNNPNPLVEKHEGLIKDPSKWNGSYYESTNFFEIKAQTFNLPTTPLRSNITIFPSDNCSSTEAMIDCAYQITLINQHNNVVGQLFKGNNTLTFAPGLYKIRVRPRGQENPNSHEDKFFSVALRWFEPTQEQADHSILFTSGNRIKQTVLEDGHGNKIIKKYDYNQPGTNITSGKIFSLPAYYDVEFNGNYYTLHNDFYAGARPGSPMSYHQGNHEGYEYVTEYVTDVSNGNYGKTVYNFTTIPDGGEFYTFPFSLPIDNEWMRGKPISIEYYKKTNNGYSLLKSTKNTYSVTSQSGTQYSLTPEMNEIVHINTNKLYLQPLMLHKRSDSGDPIDPQNPNIYKYYYIRGEAQHLAQTTETNYFDDNTFLKTETKYYYESDKHYLPTKTEVTTSTGDKMITKTFYPDDITSASSLAKGDAFTAAEYTAIDKLKKRSSNTSSSLHSLHRPATPVQTESYEVASNGTERLLSIQRNLFAQDPTSNLLLPSIVQSSKSTDALEDRLIYLKYDSKGNPLEVSLKNGMVASYIWGHNKTMPIAKIENASHEEIAAALGVSLETLESYGGNTAFIGMLRINLPKAMVSTYTYKPLVGITSMTDPRGYKTTYEYDEFNRLKYVKDADGNILSENQYKYKNQN
ncbi:RHS repeat domain-containing protein [Pseudofulvibacter geojedonensis]|uniref:RHS repeat domain-containing protein n=1 Tax=Pseudofulvibacter geojedonensis TaxID=1123758 RepID=A0ABW3I051_9FLAO